MRNPSREEVKAVLYQGLLGWDRTRVEAGDLGYVQEKYEELTDKVMAFFAMHYNAQPNGFEPDVAQPWIDPGLRPMPTFNRKTRRAMARKDA